MFMKTLRMAVSVFSLILASAVPGSAQAQVFVNGNTSFTVTWQGVKEGATLLATATFTVSNFSGTSFVMTVTNVANTMPTSPNINGRLTAFGFGLMPEGTFSNQVPGSIYQWAFTNFPAFQRVDVCLTSGGGCAGGGAGGLNQGQSTPDSHSVTITGAFANGVTIVPIPAKFQTSLGSLETDGVVIDPPPTGASDLTIAKTHTPGIAIPGETVTYTVTVSNVGSAPSSGTVTVTETPPPGLTVTALSGAGWTCTVATRTCTRSDALAPGVSYSSITVTTSVGAGAAPGTVTNIAVVSGGGDPNTTNNTATDPTIIAAPAPGMDLTITKRHSPNTVVPGQTFTYYFYRYRVERGELAVERRGDRDRDAAGGPDGYGALWRRLDLHSRDTDLHSKRRARPGVELPGDHGDDECRRQCGAWHGDEHRGRIRRRRPEHRQQHGDRSNSHHLSGSRTRPHAYEGADRGRRHGGATNHLHPQGDERRQRRRRAAPSP